MLVGPVSLASPPRKCKRLPLLSLSFLFRPGSTVSDGPCLPHLHMDPHHPRSSCPLPPRSSSPLSPRLFVSYVWRKRSLQPRIPDSSLTPRRPPSPYFSSVTCILTPSLFRPRSPLPEITDRLSFGARPLPLPPWTPIFSSLF